MVAAWLLPPWRQCILFVCSNFKPLCHKVTSASNMYAANPGWLICIVSMLCCHCWMFSLSDALPMHSYPSKVWVLCQCGRADLCAAQLIVSTDLILYMKSVVYHG